MRHFNWLARISAVALSFSLVSCADQDVRNDLERLSLRVDSLAVTLNDLVDAVAAQRRGQRLDTADSATVSVAGAVALGSSSAPIVVVEFTDYECPFCKRHVAQTLPALKQGYIETGSIRYVVKDNPLPFHTKALSAAIAARCAFEQSEAHYWMFHDALFAHEGELSDGAYIKAGESLGLDGESFSACLKSETPAHVVADDQLQAKQAGLTGTPAFVVGVEDGQGRVHGVVIRGAQPFAAFQLAIDEAISATTPRM